MIASGKGIGAAAATLKEQRYGVGLRRPHFDEIFEHNPGIDFLEIITENFMGFGGRAHSILARARERWDVLPHGVGISIAGPDPIDRGYLGQLKDFLDWLKPPWYSDHLTYSSAYGVQYHDLIPFPFCEDSLRHVAGRISQVQEHLGIPFAIENACYYVSFPSSEMSEVEFIRELVRRTGCGVLLDINNVWVNSRNHGYDPREFITQIPAECVWQYNMAGHDASGEFFVDTHGDRVTDEVLELYAFALQTTGPAWTVFEWDNNIPPLEVLLGENKKVRDAGTRALDLLGEGQYD